VSGEAPDELGGGAVVAGPDARGAIAIRPAPGVAPR
jgi:hypothetical protein